MTPEELRALLERVAAGEASVDAALDRVRALPFRDVGVAKIDHHRALRLGVPEVVFGEGKTAEEIVVIGRSLVEAGQNLLVTRLDAARAAAVQAELPELVYAARARTGRITLKPVPRRDVGPVAIVTGGTSDRAVAEEAAETLDAMGYEARRLYDVGVAGIHRLLHGLDALGEARAVIAIAGMEGALPSVVGGIVSAPVVAVPTSIGYGTALGGFTPLFAMLTSCASGITVVNIDNGFGAALAVHRMLSGGPARAASSEGRP